MVIFWWMCLPSFRSWKQIWRVLDGHLRHLLLVMSLDCSLAIHHKKGEYIWMESLLIGGDFFFNVLELLWSYRLYLGASLCTYIFWLMMYLFWCLYSLWVVYDRGRHYGLISVSCFTLCYIDYWFIFMKLFMIYIFYFMLCEIKNLFCFTCIFHTYVYVFVKCYRNIQVDSIVLLSTLATDR